MNRAGKVLLSALILLCLSSAARANPQTVRVLVTEQRTAVQLTVKGAWVLRSLPSGSVVAKGTNLQAKLTPTPTGFSFQGRAVTATGLSLEPAEERDLYLDRSRFRGLLRFYRDPRNLLFAVNVLDLEGYLYGVLHHEVGAWWPMAALEAQAVAARTYALYETQASRSQLYDLKSGTSSQVYGGSTTERYRTKKAVDRTRGQVLTYQGKLFPAYFHATCAGLTAGASELWKINVPPLAGSVVCNYCRISPHYYWRATVPFSEIEQKLQSSGRPIGQLLSVALVTRTPSFRVGSLKFTGTSGEAVIAAKDFRVWIGGEKIKSTSFTVQCTDDTATFRGKGWGHGVGLCQWGSLGQSLVGRSKEDILGLYYPAAKITSNESLRL